MDLFGERVAGRVSERPGGGASGVVPERERGVEMFGPDGLLSVEQRVDKREADDVRFGAGGELPGQAVGGLGELRVEPPPQLARVRGERDFAGGVGGASTLVRQRARPVPFSGSGSPPSGSSRTRRTAAKMNLFRNPLAISTVVV